MEIKGAVAVHEQEAVSHHETMPPSRKGNYEPVRFNAMKHGILARLAVLAHEDHAEFDGLLAALMAEHRPAGMTEQHLVEELAAIIWRKRRVLLAEGARINDGLKLALKNPGPLTSSAAPFQRGLSDANTDLRDLVGLTAEDILEHQHDTSLELASTRKAAAILREGGPHAYAQALGALVPDSREWWEEYVAQEKYRESAEGLVDFIRDVLEPLCHRMAQEAQCAPAIKRQILGAGLQADRLEQLNRYETHLDRKFERTLAMLLKLKELRGG